MVERKERGVASLRAGSGEGVLFVVSLASSQFEFGEGAVEFMKRALRGVLRRKRGQDGVRGRQVERGRFGMVRVCGVRPLAAAL